MELHKTPPNTHTNTFMYTYTWKRLLASHYDLNTIFILFYWIFSLFICSLLSLSLFLIWWLFPLFPICTHFEWDGLCCGIADTFHYLLWIGTCDQTNFMWNDVKTWWMVIWFLLLFHLLPSRVSIRTHTHTQQQPTMKYATNPYKWNTF